MPAYAVSRLTIHVREAFERYAALAPQTVVDRGGKYLFRGGTSSHWRAAGTMSASSSSSSRPPTRPQAWYESAEYAALRRTAPERC